MEVVTDFYTGAGTNLVFPLSGHNFGICSGNVDTSVKARLVVSVSNEAAKGHIGTGRAVVGTLLAGVAVVGPS